MPADVCEMIEALRYIRAQLLGEPHTPVHPLSADAFAAVTIEALHAAAKIAGAADDAEDADAEVERVLGELLAVCMEMPLPLPAPAAAQRPVPRERPGTGGHARAASAEVHPGPARAQAPAHAPLGQPDLDTWHQPQIDPHRPPPSGDNG